MVWFRLSLVLILAACTAPGGYFQGAEVTRVTVDGVSFDVRTRRELAEAMRVGPAFAPRAQPFFPPAQVAMEVVSGCRVERIGGDQIQITGILDCPDVQQAPPLAARYDCHRVGDRRDIACNRRK